MRDPVRPSILLVEDDDTDIIHFRRLAEKYAMAHDVAIANDGETALAMLREAGGHKGVSPFVVLTDLNMPGMTGHELIEDIRRERTIGKSLIFVISTSDLETDMKRAYDNGVAGYVIKDAAGAAFEETVRMLRHYCAAVAVGTLLQ